MLNFNLLSTEKKDDFLYICCVSLVIKNTYFRIGFYVVNTLMSSRDERLILFQSMSKFFKTVKIKTLLTIESIR